jgi:hypothetical protein
MNRKMNLSIGLLQHELGWELLLEQIGVSWNTITDIHSLSHASLSTLIVNRTLTHSEEVSVRQFAQSGGAVLFTIRAKTMEGFRAGRKKYIASLLPQRRPEYLFDDICDIYQHVIVFDHDALIRSESIGAGTQSYCGIDVARCMTDGRSMRKNFPANARRLPNERTVRCSKNMIRRIVQSHLEFLHHRQGLPFVHKWYFPDNAPTIFTFRIDSDKGTRKEIEELFQICDRHDIPATWFLDVRSHEQWLSYFKKFQRQEIGIHCYDHVVHNSTIVNKENFEKAKDRLEYIGIHPVGITAPTGEWNVAVGSAMEQMSMMYSSEFGYDCDNLPSYPVMKDRFSSVVQLPVHPVCAGSLRRAGMSRNEMVSYFQSVIDEKISRSEPVCLYHHPTHPPHEIFNEVFKYIHTRKIRPMLYREYARWWNERRTNRLSAVLDGTRLLFAGNGNEHLWARVSMPDRTETLVPAHSDIDLSTVTFRTSNSAPLRNIDDAALRRFSLRHVIQDLLDWWIKTTE